jgi:hypothetical protein
MFFQNEIVSLRFKNFNLLDFDFVFLVPDEMPTEDPPRVEVIQKSNLTEKPTKEEPIAPQRISRPVVPDAG